jgi:chorismate synthase
MATGEDILFELYFKPTSTIKKEQKTINRDGNPVIITSEATEIAQVEESETAYRNPVMIPTEATENAECEGSEIKRSLEEPRLIMAEGRHDPCVLPRAVPIVESLAALALMDLLLESHSQFPH